MTSVSRDLRVDDRVVESVFESSGDRHDAI